MSSPCASTMRPSIEPFSSGVAGSGSAHGSPRWSNGACARRRRGSAAPTARRPARATAPAPGRGAARRCAVQRLAGRERDRDRGGQRRDQHREDQRKPALRVVRRRCSPGGAMRASSQREPALDERAVGELRARRARARGMGVLAEQRPVIGPAIVGGERRHAEAARRRRQRIARRRRPRRRCRVRPVQRSRRAAAQPVADALAGDAGLVDANSARRA